MAVYLESKAIVSHVVGHGGPLYFPDSSLPAVGFLFASCVLNTDKPVPRDSEIVYAFAYVFAASAASAAKCFHTDGPWPGVFGPAPNTSSYFLFLLLLPLPLRICFSWSSSLFFSGVTVFGDREGASFPK